MENSHFGWTDLRGAGQNNVGAVICSQAFWLQEHPFGPPGSLDTIRRLFEMGVRWETSPADEIARLRRCLLKTSDDMFIDAMKLFATKDYCSPAILQALGRTPLCQ